LTHCSTCYHFIQQPENDHLYDVVGRDSQPSGGGGEGQIRAKAVYDYQAGKLELWQHFENDVPFSCYTIIIMLNFSQLFINALLTGDVEHYGRNRLTAM